MRDWQAGNQPKLPKATRPCWNRAVISCWKEERDMLRLRMCFDLAIHLPVRWIALLFYLLR
jgi:hypothetical protein